MADYKLILEGLVENNRVTTFCTERRRDNTGLQTVVKNTPWGVGAKIQYTLKELEYYTPLTIIKKIMYLLYNGLVSLF